MRLDTPPVLRGVAAPHVWTQIRVIGGVITTSVTAGGKRLGILSLVLDLGLGQYIAPSHLPL
jgi:hypothetical protein